ncbi:MAG: AMP-binding protein, partial [Clostridia bacterium]|nr:AMP-binding protein [Clostridia bacterium]
MKKTQKTTPAYEVTGFIPDAAEMNCCEFLLECNGQYGDIDLLQHLDRRYKRSEMIRDIDAIAAYMQQELKLKRGDVYSIFMPTTIEGIISFYALNSIGVIVNFIHPLLPPDMVKDFLLDVEAKGVMILDLLSIKHIDMINSLGIPCMVCSCSDYASALKGTALKIPEALLKAVYLKLKNKDTYNRAVKHYHGAKQLSNNGEDIAVYLNGGGTTGKSKT